MQFNQLAVQDFNKHARSVKAFSILHAVAAMYCYTHPNYITGGLDLLSELSSLFMTEITVRGQLPLANAGDPVSTAYITRVYCLSPLLHSVDRRYDGILSHVTWDSMLTPTNGLQYVDKYQRYTSCMSI